MDPNSEDLRLLAMFHFVVAGMAAVVSLFPIIHLAVGVAMVAMASVDPQAPFPIRLVGWIFVAFASLFILCGLTFSGCLALAGRCLQRRRRYTFCLVMAALACIFVPFGTVLGVFSFIVLTRPEVRASFGPASPGAPKLSNP